MEEEGEDTLFDWEAFKGGNLVFFIFYVFHCNSQNSLWLLNFDKFVQKVTYFS